MTLPGTFGFLVAMPQKQVPNIKMVTRKIVASVEYKVSLVDNLPLFEQELSSASGGSSKR